MQNVKNELCDVKIKLNSCPCTKMEALRSLIDSWSPRGEPHTPETEGGNFTDILRQNTKNTVFDDLRRKGSVYCWVALSSIDSIRIQDEFTFDFVLSIEYQNKSFDCKFTADYTQITALYNTANNNPHYFATECFPLHRKRSFLLREQMKVIEQYIILDDKIQTGPFVSTLLLFDLLRNDAFGCIGNNIQHEHITDILNVINTYGHGSVTYVCTGPTVKQRFRTTTVKPNIYDGYALSHALTQLFNTPLFVSQNDLYHQLNIGDTVRNMLQKVAREWLDHLRVIYEESIIKPIGVIPYKRLLADVRYKYMKFHLVIAAAEPNTAVTHWCLKFEGVKHLLTVEWCRNSSVRLMVLNNTAIEQRVCWYSCNMNAVNPSFTERWETLVKCDISKNYFTGWDHHCITGSDLGNLIGKWIQLNHKYNGISNNCQHFVRDLIATFHKAGGRILSRKMQTNNFGYVEPVTGAHNARQQVERPEYIRDVLAEELIRSKVYREMHSDRLKMFLYNRKLSSFYDHLLDAGFYDDDYHMISDDDLLMIGMTQREAELFLKHKPFYLKEFLNHIGLNKNQYYDRFIDNKYSDSDFKDICTISADDLSGRILMDVIECAIFKKEVNALLRSKQRTKDRNKVKEWLSGFHLESYYDVFIEAGFGTLSKIQYITKSEVMQMNITTFFDQKIILDHVKKLNQRYSSNNDEASVSNVTDEANDPIDGKQLLTQWGLQMYIEAMVDDQGWVDPMDWQDLDQKDLKEFGFKDGHCRKFRRKYSEWYNNMKFSRDQPSV
eukprot:239827_1